MRSLVRRFIGSVFKSASGFSAVSTSPLAAYIDASRLVQADKLIRLGTVFGGWLIPSESGLNESSVCYLAGAGEDISFDCALARIFHCNVRIIDPTPRAIQHFKNLEQAVSSGTHFPINNTFSETYEIAPADFARMRLLPVGLADRDVEMKFYLPKNPAHVSCSTVNLQGTDEYFTAQCHRLSTIMEQHGDTKLDLLKMDIEGGEYVVIRDILASGLLPRILLIEFDEAHTPLDNNAGTRIKNHIDQLIGAGMTCVAVEGCNATFVRVGGM